MRPATKRTRPDLSIVTVAILAPVATGMLWLMSEGPAPWDAAARVVAVAGLLTVLSAAAVRLRGAYEGKDE